MVALLLRARGTIPPGLGAIGDLAASWTAPGEIELTSTAFADNEQAQFWIEGESDRGDWLTLSDPTPLEVFEGNIYNTRVRHAANGLVGPASNIARFSAFNSAAVLKDSDTATYLGAGTGITSLNLASMDGGALSFAAGDIVFIYACFVSGNQAVTLGALTGWEIIQSINDVSSGSRRAMICAWKIADGTETTVSMFTSIAVANVRVNYYALSFSVLGHVFLGDTPSAQFATNTPTAQSILTANHGNHRIAIAIALGTTSTPTLTLTGYSPQIDLPYSQTTTLRGDNRLKMAILPPASFPANIAASQNDAGNNILTSFYLVVEPS